MVHWDRQSPGVGQDHADRLVDLYASGEQRSYGPLFLQRKMNISNQAFAVGDFSLTIRDVQVCTSEAVGEDEQSRWESGVRLGCSGEQYLYMPGKTPSGLCAATFLENKIHMFPVVTKS